MKLKLKLCLGWKLQRFQSSIVKYIRNNQLLPKTGSVILLDSPLFFPLLSPCLSLVSGRALLSNLLCVLFIVLPCCCVTAQGFCSDSLLSSSIGDRAARLFPPPCFLITILRVWSIYVGINPTAFGPIVDGSEGPARGFTLYKHEPIGYLYNC